MDDSRIHIGIGGWTFEPWRSNFYPKGLPHKQELHYASRQLTAIEINGTYYSTFKPQHFANWAAETPDGFVFSMKANRFATNRKLLATAGESIDRFVNSGIAELKDKLGPIVWQMMPTKKFDPDDFAGFLALLPKEVAGRPLTHVIDARHASFDTPQYFDLLGRYGATTVHTDSPDYPPLVHARSDVAYLRLMRTHADVPTGYEPAEIAKWTQGAKAWAAQGASKQVYMFFISGAKERAPAAAQHAIELLKAT